MDVIRWFSGDMIWLQRKESQNVARPNLIGNFTKCDQENGLPKNTMGCKGHAPCLINVIWHREIPPEAVTGRQISDRTMGHTTRDYLWSGLIEGCWDGETYLTKLSALDLLGEPVPVRIDRTNFDVYSETVRAVCTHN